MYKTVMDNNLSNAKQNEAGWRLPYHILIALAAFLIINSITILNVRGIVDDVDYRWNNAHHIPINTYEDDGRLNVYAALGYKGFSERHEHLINIGGPYIHIARFLLWTGDKIGIVKIFDDPYAYYLYPNEYLKIWKFIGLYKVWLFLIWLPIVVYWIGARHFSPATGSLAAWLTVSIPFITGFEPRIKADSVAMVLGFFSILWQLEYIRNHNRKYLFLAAIFLGASFAVKFNLLSAALTFLLSYLVVVRKNGQDLRSYRTWQNLWHAAVVAAITFIIANPYFVKGFISYSKMLLGQTVAVNKGKTLLDMSSIFYSIWYRIIHFDSHFGTVLNWLVIPALFFAVIHLFIKRSQRSIAGTMLLIVLIGFVAYIAVVMRDAVIYLTYYYYAPAIVLLILISDLLSAIWEKAISIGRIASFVVGMSIVFIIGFTAYENSRVFAYMVSKTNRQNMYEWIEKNIPQGTVIGIPMAPTHSYFNQWIRLDPFKYRLVHIGTRGEQLEENQPDYFIWILFSKDSQMPDGKDYIKIADFSKGTDLPHERYDLYQEEAFHVYKRVSEPDISRRSILGELEYELGALMRDDKEDEFRILQFRGLSFMPGWLNLLRKEKQTLQYDSSLSFESMIRGDKPEHAKYAYIHQIDPTMLQLWGVKYVLARVNMGDKSPFEEHVLQSGHYNLKEVYKYETMFGDGKRDVGLFYNNEYMGQVLFAQFDKKEDDNTARIPFWKTLWSGYEKQKKEGILYDESAMKKLTTDKIAVYIEIKSTTPVSVYIKGGGNEEYLDIGSGQQRIWMSYRIFKNDGVITYRVNPVEGKGSIVVNKIYASPLNLYASPVVSNAKISKRGGAAAINARSEGDVIFSLPYHKYWKATVDGVSAPVKKGLAGTVAVGIPQGMHLVEIYFN